MDRNRFDALARLLASSGSRRAALGALLGAGLVGASLDALAKKNGKKDRGQAKDKRTKKRKQQRKNRARAEAAAGCCKSGNCAPGTGKNLTRCCFEGQDLTGKSFKSSNLTQANFKDANLTNAKFQGSNLTGACLVGATITGANFKGANLSGVIRCRTITEFGEDNSGCHLGTPCCPTCEPNALCADGQRCCKGVCPLPLTCLASGACCESQADCEDRCCTHRATLFSGGCTPDISCSLGDITGPCGTDSDCAPGAEAICVCGKCCQPTGRLCFSNDRCCSGTCANLDEVEGGVCT